MNNEIITREGREGFKMMGGVLGGVEESKKKPSLLACVWKDILAKDNASEEERARRQQQESVC